MSYKDCRECKHCQPARGHYQCLVMIIPKPTSWMRDDRNECGLSGALFEPKTDKQYSEFE